MAENHLMEPDDLAGQVLEQKAGLVGASIQGVSPH